MNQALIQLILIATKIMKVAPSAVCFSAQMHRRNGAGYKSVQYDAGGACVKLGASFVLCPMRPQVGSQWKESRLHNKKRSEPWSDVSPTKVKTTAVRLTLCNIHGERSSNYFVLNFVFIFLIPYWQCNCMPNHGYFQVPVAGYGLSLTCRW